MFEFFDLDAIVDYVPKLGSVLTAARVGFFLQEHRDDLQVKDWHLDALRKHVPRQPRYFDSRREPGRFFKEWNVVVPKRILGRTWDEFSMWNGWAES